MVQETEAHVRLLANAIREFRKSLHLTQMEFAERLDISLAHVQNIECRRKNPSIKVLYKLCRMGFSIDTAFQPGAARQEAITLLGACSERDIKVIKRIVKAFLEEEQEEQRENQ